MHPLLRCRPLLRLHCCLRLYVGIDPHPVLADTRDDDVADIVADADDDEAAADDDEADDDEGNAAVDTHQGCSFYSYFCVVGTAESIAVDSRRE